LSREKTSHKVMRMH